ncbi:MAG: hypothetical protein AAFU67_01540, partial [Bacteroidota bacterium]
TAYSSMLSRLNAAHLCERAGNWSDLNFLHQDEWLVDAAVIERLVERNGQVEVHLVFAHSQSPLTFLNRFITRCFNHQRASMTAALMRRQAAKDQRGTIRLTGKTWQVAPN